LSWTISLKERIDVSGVRNSWLTVETKSSLHLVEFFQPLVGRHELGARRFENLAHKAVHQPPQVSDRRPAAPDARAFRCPFEYVHEQHGLAAFDHRLAGDEGDDDKEPDIERQRPEQGVSDRIEAFEVMRFTLLMRMILRIRNQPRMKVSVGPI